jgi:putative transposase
MRKSKFTESQIVTTLKHVESGRQIKDGCRELGISDATYYVWKSKYRRIKAADVLRLKALEEENSRLKRMFADLSLENTALKDVIPKNYRPGAQALADVVVDRCSRLKPASGLSGGGTFAIDGTLPPPAGSGRKSGRTARRVG